MPTINDITNAAMYKGSPELGGGGGFALDLDFKPLDTLVAYTVMYSKSQYDQRQKDADEKIKQLAELSAYDAATGEGKDKDEVFDKLSKLRGAYSNFASTTWNNPDDKMKANFKLQREKGELLKTINSATARQIKLRAYFDSVDADTNLNVPEKEARKKQAQKLFDDTDINTMFNIPQYDLKTPTVEPHVNDVVTTLKYDKNGNAVIEKTQKGIAFEASAAKAYLSANNLNFPVPPPEGASQEAKNAYEQQKLAFSKNELGGWVDAAKFGAAAFNDPNYKKTETTSDINVMGSPAVTKLTDQVDVEKIKASNPIYGGILKLADHYNFALAKKIEDLTNGYYTDDVTGEQVEMSGSSDTIDGLKALFIDINKPLSNVDLAKLQQYENAAPDLVSKKYIQTNDANEAAKIAEMKRNNTLDYKIAKQKADNDFYLATHPQSGGKNAATEPRKFMDLTGYTGTLSTADIAAIDPNLVTSENGVLKLTPEGLKATFNILPNGDVEVNYNNSAPATKTLAAKPNTVKVINKDKYQKESVGIAMTVLKDRKGEEGNPFTFTGKGIQDTPANTPSVSKQTMKGADGKIYTSEDGITWTAPDGTVKKLNKKK